MALTTPWAIVIGAGLLAAAVGVVAPAVIRRTALPRYEIAAAAPGEVVRVDTVTGEIVACKAGDCKVTMLGGSYVPKDLRYLNEDSPG